MPKQKVEKLYGPKNVPRQIWRCPGKRTLRDQVIGEGGIPLIPCDGDKGYSSKDTTDYEVERIQDAFKCDNVGVELHYLCKLKNYAGFWWISFIHLKALESVEDFIGRHGCYTCRHKKTQPHCSSCYHNNKMKSSIFEKLKKTTADLNTANKKLKDAEQKLSTFQKLKELKMTGPAVEQGASEAQTEIDDLRGQVRDLLEQLAAKDDQLAMLKGRVEKLEADNKELREENASLKVQLKDRDEIFDFMVEHGRTVDESLDKKGEKVSEKELRTLAPPPSAKEIEAIQKYCQIRGAASMEKNAQKRILYRIRKKIQKAKEARTV